MLKKEEVYVSVSSEKKARKLKELLDVFGFEYCVSQFLYNVFYFNDEGVFCSCHNKDYPISIGRTKVSLKELRNILAREYLKEGDFVALGYGKSVEYLGVYKTFNNGHFQVDSYLSLNSGSGIIMDGHGLIKNFIRYATEEEKQLLKPKESVIEKAISQLHEIIQGLEELKNK